jgi:uncharacterized protein (TIGR03435 family)
MTLHRSVALAVTLAIAVAGLALPQTRTSGKAFDVVSIKPNKSIESGSSISRSGGRITFANVSVRELISFAYGIAVGRDYELVGPGWLDSEKFDVVATCSPETAGDAIRQMSQSFLAERFGLRVHREEKSIKAYELVIDKTQPKLRPSSVTDPSFTFGQGHITVRGFSMGSLADRLSGPVFKLDRPIIDATGIKGIYDFDLDWSADAAVDPLRPSVFTALQEQLGLKLETRSVPMSILVVDGVNRTPTTN